MSRSSAPDRAERLTAATFRAHHRGGGVFSELISQRAGSYLALASHRLGLTPVVVTLAALLLGLGSSALLVIMADRTTAGLGLGVGLCWQLAYALDCADGQLARATGRASAAGARLDILCDVAVQVSIVAAVSAVAAAQSLAPPAWLTAAFAGTWMVNLVTSALAAGPAAASLLTARTLGVRLAKVLRDYGAVIAVAALVVAFAPGWTIWFMAVVAALNGVFLLASIGQAALRGSWSWPGPHGCDVGPRD